MRDPRDAPSRSQVPVPGNNFYFYKYKCRLSNGTIGSGTTEILGNTGSPKPATSATNRQSSISHQSQVQYTITSHRLNRNHRIDTYSGSDLTFCFFATDAGGSSGDEGGNFVGEGGANRGDEGRISSAVGWLEAMDGDGPTGRQHGGKAKHLAPGFTSQGRRESPFGRLMVGIQGLTAAFHKFLFDGLGVACILTGEVAFSFQGSPAAHFKCPLSQMLLVVAPLEGESPAGYLYDHGRGLHG